MEAKFTPGEWETIGSAHGNSLDVIHAGGRVCMMDCETNDNAEANARLIASAPDLLAVCKRLADRLGVVIESDTDDGHPESADDLAAYQDALAIIAWVEAGE